MTLLQALKFISVAQKEKDIIAPYQNHCVLLPNKALASNGVLSAGCNIAEDLECYPQTKAFINALSNCGDKLAITQLENTKLSIKSGRFSAIVSCHAEELPRPSPDPQIALISDDLRIALASVSHLAKEEGKTVLESAVLIQANTVLCSNGNVVIEYWHGIDLPTCVIPKIFVNAICDVKTSQLKGFGCSHNSVTFWFDDESWIKTQKYAENYPDFTKVLNVDNNTIKLTKELFDGIRCIESFSEHKNEIVYFSEKGIRSLKDKKEGAFYEIEGLPDGYAFKIKQLKQVEKYCNNVFFDNNRMWFYDGKARGCIIGVKP